MDILIMAVLVILAPATDAEEAIRFRMTRPA